MELREIHFDASPFANISRRTLKAHGRRVD